MLASEVDTDKTYMVDGWRGVAFYCRGPEMVDDEDTEWSGYQVETGNVIVVMVGDDREHSVDPEYLTVLPEDDYCAVCGQIGCCHDGRERE